MSWPFQLKAIVKGTVQGVGFRWTVVEIAENLNLVGQVRNVTDGTVEVIACGTKESLERFIEEIKKARPPAHVTSVETSFSKPTQIYTGFSILR